MGKLVLLKPQQISISEEKKGKQIAVKENNIDSLKTFYLNGLSSTEKKEENLITQENSNVVAEPLEIAPENNAETIEAVPEAAIEINPVNISSTSEIPAISLETNIQNTNEVTENSEEGSNETEAITLIPETKTETEVEDEMDSELKEIKERLDKVIMDLNDYKKKIQSLEEEINKNLEKSREVLKDTQAAAQIMSIQQERQKQINEETSSGEVIENDNSRILQKSA